MGIAIPGGGIIPPGVTGAGIVKGSPVAIPGRDWLIGIEDIWTFGLDTLPPNFDSPEKYLSIFFFFYLNRV